jgi:hypothetical protein
MAHVLAFDGILHPQRDAAKIVGGHGFPVHMWVAGRHRPRKRSACARCRPARRRLRAVARSRPLFLTNTSRSSPPTRQSEPDACAHWESQHARDRSGTEIVGHRRHSASIPNRESGDRPALASNESPAPLAVSLLSRCRVVVLSCCRFSCLPRGRSSVNLLIARSSASRP